MDANMIGKTTGTLGQKWIDTLARLILEKGISAKTLKVVSLLVTLMSGILLTFGVVGQGTQHWIHPLTGFVLLLAGLCELLNHAMNRISGNITKFGLFSNSVMDRYADMALIGGAITYFALRWDIVFVVLSSLALVGTIMTSYTRARAESLLPGKYGSGYMQRPERIGILAVACLLNRLYGGVFLIAVFANIATLHRIWDIRQTIFNLEHPQDAGKGYVSPSAPAIVRVFQRIIFWTYPRQTWQHDTMSAGLLLLTCLALFLPSR